MAKRTTTGKRKTAGAADLGARDAKRVMKLQREVGDLFTAMTTDFKLAKRQTVTALTAREGAATVEERQRTQQPLGGTLDDVIARHQIRMADEYTFQDPYGDLVPKRTIIQRLRSGRAIFNDFTYSDFDVRVYGDMAIVTNHITIKDERRGRDISGTYTETHTLRRTPQGWQFISSAMNLVQPLRAEFVATI